MGSTAAVMMVSDPLSVQPKKLHPFFVAPRAASKETPITDVSSDRASSPKPCSETAEESDGDSRASTERTTRNRGKRKSEAEPDGPQVKRRGRPRKSQATSSQTGIASIFIRQGQHAGPPEPPAGSSGGDSGEETAKNGQDGARAVSRTSEPALNAGLPLPGRPESEPLSQKEPPPPRPQKLLVLNTKTGTIGPPPNPKEPKLDTKQTRTSPRTRQQKKLSLTVSVRYGQDDESRQRIGSKIQAILTSTPAEKQDSRKPSSRTDKPSGDASISETTISKKETHPFFMGKPPKPTPSAPVTEPAKPAKSTAPASASVKMYTSTPCSPKKPRGRPPGIRMPQFGVKSLGLKVPGASLPAWPWKGMVHVRPEEDMTGATTGAAKSGLFSDWTLRKSKSNAVVVEPHESVLRVWTQRLDVPGALKAVRSTDSEAFAPPPPELRLPRKHFESGRKLRDRVAPELASRHASLDRLFDSIETSLSAFDQSQCEPLIWAQKYAPICATEVLQAGREPTMLRDWLAALKVQSVDTGPGEAGAGGKGGSAKTDAKKKKRKRNKLEGFVVSSDDEADEMGEVSDTDIDLSPSGRQGMVKKTVVRAGDLAKKRKARLTNAVVISGPHGCGKTAAVYAAAKELDFEVFEINASSRRSGKDVLEKIGDMTRNHLVHPQQQGPKPSPPDASEIVEEDVSNEIKSGRQATMNSFFTPRAQSSATKKAPKPQQPEKPSPAEAAKPPPPKNQKQSLILLEEVDILYEEDKQFWATVMGLIVQSKRPFIMTCNDETMVPLQNLRLHGIFRFTPPPTSPAVDRLLLIAANEGHALRRAAVKSLYESRGYDFRASLMDLNYWCQIGVGDRRGGFDWFYLRWPKGVDLDKDGQVVRVVSEDTYQEGMGWLGHDNVMDGRATSEDVEEELMREAWDSWQLDIGQWEDFPAMETWASHVESITGTRDGRADMLDAYAQFADAMSAADIASSSAFAAGNLVSLDCSLPELPAKVREDYTIGMPLLEATTVIRYKPLALPMSTALKSIAKHTLQSITEDLDASHRPAPELDPLQEADVIHAIHDHRTKPSPSDPAVARIDFAIAFDPIAAADSSSLLAAYLDPSVFDRNLEPIALDVSPYVRSIVAYDARLQRQRLRLSNLVSEGGRGPAKSAKRMRTTRAAMSALEGGARSTKRKERWFKAELNAVLVMRTAGEGWTEAALEAMKGSGDGGVGVGEEASSPAAPDKASPGNTSGGDDSCDELA